MSKERGKKICTSCAKPLPRNRPQWGLVWDDKETGMCKKCLYLIRKSIGYYEKNPAAERAERPKEFDNE